MRLTLIVPFLALALVAPAVAEETCYTTSTTDETQLVVTLGVTGEHPTFYLANDHCQLEGDLYDRCIFSIWFYEESNGIPGLQRQDEMRNDMAGCNDETWGDVIFGY